MKVLFCTPRLPYPPLKGDQVVSYYRAKYLSKRHELHLLSFYETEQDLAYIQHLEELFSEIYLIRLTRVQSYFNMVYSLLTSSKPLQVAYYNSRQFMSTLNHLLDQHDYDLVHVFLVRLASYLKVTSKPKILEFVDSMTLNLERRVAQARGLRRLILAEELRRVHRYERLAIHAAHVGIVVAERDRQALDMPGIQVIPNGVDTEVFTPDPSRSYPRRLVFSGNMGYEPNISAVRWFLENCYESIRRSVPGVELVIAGADPSNEVKGWSRLPGIHVTGRVSSMADVLRQAAVAIAPLQSGSGIQNKVLEAMACGLPVVATTYGLGDIKARSGESIVIADAPISFANAVTSLLRDAQSRQRIGEAARHFVIEHHSWEAVNAEVERIYHELAADVAPMNN